MGCTNSGMVHEAASDLANNAKDLVDKGENLVHGIEESAKDTLQQGIDRVQTTITNIQHTTEDTLESAAEKLNDTFTLDKGDGNMTQNTTDDETISEDETVAFTEVETTVEGQPMNAIELNEKTTTEEDNNGMQSRANSIDVGGNGNEFKIDDQLGEEVHDNGMESGSVMATEILDTDNSDM